METIQLQKTGYMGFGMRSQEYTRKPKKAFEKIKEYRKKSNDYKIEMIDNNEKKKYQSYYLIDSETTFEKIVKKATYLIVLIGLAAMISCLFVMFITSQ